jgi:hypothetical protein
LSTLVVLSACDNGSSPDTTSAQSSPPSPQANGAVPASDTFDAESLDRSWSIVEPDLVQATVRDSALSLSLTGPALWFHGSQGVLVFKSVTGDFEATATVLTESAARPGQPPASMIRLAGLMARNPASDRTQMQNYVHIVVGNGPDGVLAVENKTTVDSNSIYEAPQWRSSDAELRICRIGSNFSLYKRPVGSDTWQLAASYDRPDLPATLQVGVDIYSPNTPPDLRASVDEVGFQEVDDSDSCDADSRG